jgi:peptidoglycan/LPS O-acetylase OafA/YrhL
MVFAYTAIASQVKSPGPFGHVTELFLLQAWSPDSPTYAGGNGVTWSLSVEMFFYLVFPFVLVALRRLRGRGLAVTAAVTLVLITTLPLIVAQAGVDTYSNLYYWLFFVFPPYRFGEFLLGMLLARAMVLGLRIPAPARTAVVAAAGVAGLTWIMTSFTVRTGIPFVRPLVALLAIPFFAAHYGLWNKFRWRGGPRPPAGLPGPGPRPLRRPALPGGKASGTPPAPRQDRPAPHCLAARAWPVQASHVQ